MDKENSPEIPDIEIIDSGKPYSPPDIQSILARTVIPGQSPAFSRRCEACNNLIEFDGDFRSYSHRHYCNVCQRIARYESHRRRNLKYQDKINGIVQDTRKDTSPSPLLKEKFLQFLGGRGSKDSDKDT